MSEVTSTSFSDVLKPPPAPVEVQETAAVETAAAQTPAVESTAQSETQSETVSAPDTDWQKQANGFKGAMLEERRKRQEAEQRLDAFLRTQATPPARQPAAPTYFEDPEAFVEQKVTETAQQMNLRFATATEVIARQAHSDYDEKLQAYKELVQTNPALHAHVMNSANPGEEAYQQGKRFLFEKEYGSDPDAIVKKLSQKLEPQVKAKVEQEITGKVARKTNQPTDILGARAAGGNAAPDFRPSGWADVLAKKKR